MYNKNRTKILMFVILGTILFGGVMALQSGFAVTSIWEADVEIDTIGSDGNVIYRDALTGASINTFTKVNYDFDGSPTASISSMDSNGLLPEYQWTLGDFFHTNQYGDPDDRDRTPDVVNDVDGTRYLTYYFGFSYSIVTRSSHQDISTSTPVLNFDYFGQNIDRTWEYPEFAISKVMVDVGIRLDNIDDTIPSTCGVQNVKLLNTRMSYTGAESMGLPSDIGSFNREYDWETNKHHKGFINSPLLDVRYKSFVSYYSSIVSVDTSMSPGSEWVYLTSTPTQARTYNVFDVELIMDFLVKVELTYEISADLGGYLEKRLDIVGTAEPIEDSLWGALIAMFMSFVHALAMMLGISDELMLIILAIAAVVGVFMTFKLLRTGARYHPAGRMMGL